ncbi:MAG: hypothetical protein JJE44_00445 [Flavobacteriaceae bacterium]|nr:hypothetical protein [Flavobacteriaceae bacterium]
MKKLLLLLILILIFSCTKKEVKLPVLAEKGIQELHNHSQVWLFFEIENKDTIAIVNRKNTISTTHWIYNIDKRLPLKAIIPSIIKLQDKHANSMHSEKGMHDYFSYSDTISKKLSFLEFDGVIFKTDSFLSKPYIKDHIANYSNYNNISLLFTNTKNWIDDSPVEKRELKQALNKFIEFSAEGKQIMLHLNFTKNISYQNYMYFKTTLNNLCNEVIKINKLEFIFDEEKVHFCY